MNLGVWSEITEPVAMWTVSATDAAGRLVNENAASTKTANDNTSTERRDAMDPPTALASRV